MKKKMEVASPFHLHTVINDQISQKDHGYVTPVTNESAINVLSESTWRKSYASYLKTFLIMYFMEKYNFSRKKDERKYS